MTSTLPPDSQAELDAVLRLDDAWNAAYHHRAPKALEEVLATDWMAFFPDGRVVYREELLRQLLLNPPAAVMFERHASRVFGGAAITRGTLYLDGVRAQSFLRVYAKRGGEWQAVSVQVVE